MKDKLRKLWAKIFPYIHVRSHVLTVNQLAMDHRVEKKRLQAEYKKELESTKEAADKVFKRVSKIDWRRGNYDEVYSMVLILDPRLMKGYGPNELEFIAEQFGRMVEREVRCCKFIEKANWDYDRDNDFKYRRIPE